MLLDGSPFARYRRRMLPRALILMLLIGCGSSAEVPDAAPPSKGFSEACSGDECADGLFCAQGGHAQGLCTADCDSSGPCESHFGPDAFCSTDYVCLLSCSGGGSCPSGATCHTATNPDTCQR